MSSESIPVGLQTLLAKHYFLAQITRGYKPCMTNMTLADASSWVDAFWRRWYGESKKSVLSDVEKIISETIDSITVHQNKPEFLRLIINALASTRVGIESMTTTYRNFPETVGSLKVQLANIDLQLQRHRSMIKGYDNNHTSGEIAIIDTIVKSSDQHDKEGLRQFLLGKTPPPPIESDVNNQRSPDKSDSNDKIDKLDRLDRLERSDRNEKLDRSDRSDRSDRLEREDGKKRRRRPRDNRDKDKDESPRKEPDTVEN